MNIIDPAIENSILSLFDNIICDNLFHILLCKGKLTNALGLGGLFKHHSKLL